MTVHTPGDPDKAVSVTTAAALAESAKKLAQEAASFIDEEEEVRSIHIDINYGLMGEAFRF